MKQGAALLLVVILTITTGFNQATTLRPDTTGFNPTTPSPSSNVSLSTTAPQSSSTPSPQSSSTALPQSRGTPSPQSSSTALPQSSGTPPPPSPPPPPVEPSDVSAGPASMAPPLPWSVDNLMNPQDVLLQEIRSLDETSTDEEIQKVLVKATEHDAKKSTPMPVQMSGKKGPLTLFKSTDQSAPEPLQKVDPRKGVSYFTELMEDEDLNYNETDDMVDDPDWTDDEDDDDDEDEDDDLDDEITDDEEILFDQNCPSGCRCSEQFTGATTARCTEFSSTRTFGSDMAHLKIENAADVELGPHALREKGLYQLRSIAIVTSKITTFDKTAFDGIPNLFSVNLTRNRLRSIHPDTFQNNTQLSLLTVSGNPLQFNQEKSGPYTKYFLDAPTVSDLDLSGNGLTRLLPTTFVRMPRLVYISLKNNMLRTLEKTVFNPVDQLEELDLSHNQLNGLPADVFDSNEYLETLHISGNNFSSLATIAASRLVSLDASKNRIKIIAKDDLVGIPQMERLVLKTNGLKRIHPHAFIDLLDLTYLDISDNKLSALEEHHLRANSRLETIIMNDNPGLKNLPVFQTQDGTFSVNRFECANCGLRVLLAGTFDAMPAMTRLNLARNGLTRFPKGLLGSMSSLRELDLSDNQFTTLEIDVFEGLRGMTKLNLAGNPLTTLEVAPFLLTPSLSRLDVSRCNLNRVWSGSKVPLQGLRFLSVRGNHIERINVEDLGVTPKLSGLDISHNPFACNQEFNAVIQWLVDHGVSPTETLRYMSNYGDAEYYTEPEGLNQWTDLAKVVCDSIEDGPPPRIAPRRPSTQKGVDPTLLDDLDELAKPFDHGIATKDDELEDAWRSEEQEYEEYTVRQNHLAWYGGTLWPVMTVLLVTLTVVLFVVNFGVYLSKRRGRGPVIRTPMMLRPGLVDNKNCGLVYKPLQEEIPTPQMAKRGSFYSSSTFHYDKIVPESV